MCCFHLHFDASQLYNGHTNSLSQVLVMISQDLIEALSFTSTFM